MPEPASLRVSLIRRLAIALLAVALVGTFAAYQLGSFYGNTAYDRALADDVLTLAEQISIKDGELHVSLPTEALKWLLADQGEVVLYRVTNLRSGKVVDEKGDLGSFSTTSNCCTTPVFVDRRVDQRPMRVSYMVRLIPPENVPVLIEIGETTGRRNQMTDFILVGALLLMVIMSVVSISLVWHGVGRALSPLKLLEAEAKTRSGSDLAPLDPMHVPEEVRGLINAINSMMERVSSSIQSQNHFIANAAHQLRTPLAGLRLQAQLGLKAASPAATRFCLTEVESSAVRACDLVEKLLVLAKAENAANITDDEPVDFEAVARQVIDRFLLLADQHCVDLGIAGGGEDLRVAGNAFLFAELVGNLVDNAILHGRHGGRVTIELGRYKGQVIVAIVDDGPGFAEADPKRLFTRFYRHDALSHTGSGLGLAIVHEIVDRYDGTITLNSTVGEGSRVEVSFPIWHNTRDA
jgi:two-component system sensor histidine kinase TctE